jgi:hypothetical protein
MSDEQAPAKRNTGSVFFGIVLGAGLTCLFILLGANLPPVDMIVAFGIGIAQAIYIVPVGIYFLRRKQTRTAIGLLIAALFVLAANIAWWVVIRDFGKGRF